MKQYFQISPKTWINRDTIRRVDKGKDCYILYLDNNKTAYINRGDRDFNDIKEMVEDQEIEEEIKEEVRQEVRRV